MMRSPRLMTCCQLGFHHEEHSGDCRHVATSCELTHYVRQYLFLFGIVLNLFCISGPDLLVSLLQQRLRGLRA